MGRNTGKRKELRRTFYQDRHNAQKAWEVVRLSGGGYYLRQYIGGKQYGRGIRTTKQHISAVGIMGFKQIPEIR